MERFLCRAPRQRSSAFSRAVVSAFRCAVDVVVVVVRSILPAALADTDDTLKRVLIFAPSAYDQADLGAFRQGQRALRLKYSVLIHGFDSQRHGFSSPL